jgi:hypothetical protein
MSRWSFLLWLSACAGAIAAIATYERSGRYVLREIAVPIEQRRFGGSVRAYLWQRHVVPQFVMNAWFNGWAGLSMVNGSIHDPASSLSRSGVLLDAGATGLLLTFGIALGTRGYVNFDLRWGVAPRLPDRAPSGLRSSLRLLAGTAGAWLALSLGMFALDIDRVHTWPLVAAHGVLLGLLCSVIAYWSARWTLSAAATQPADAAPATASIAQVSGTPGPNS